MANPVERRNPKGLQREAMRLADDYYDLDADEMQATLAALEADLIAQLREAEATLPREELRAEKATIADERYILERIENLYRTFHRDTDAGPDQTMQVVPEGEVT
jgi:hypothetical protein